MPAACLRAHLASIGRICPSLLNIAAHEQKGRDDRWRTAEVARAAWLPRRATAVGAGVEPGAAVSTGTGVMVDRVPACTMHSNNINETEIFCFSTVDIRRCLIICSVGDHRKKSARESCRLF